jgi:hypothetical protein
MRFLGSHWRVLVVAGALFLLGSAASIALADSQGRYWGWSEINADTIYYNLQVPAPEAEAHTAFLRVKIFGTKADGSQELICQRDEPNGFTYISCTTSKNKYASAMASVRIKNKKIGDGGLFNSEQLPTEMVEFAPTNGKAVVKVFVETMTKCGAEKDDNQANSNHNDNCSDNSLQ